MHFPNCPTLLKRSTQAAIIIFVLALVVKLLPTPAKSYWDHVSSSTEMGIEKATQLNKSKLSMAKCISQPNFLDLDCEKNLKRLKKETNQPV